ncbi:MAG: AbrB/MazE/SpoVT family DNA-binding domain-containing protein [Desulfobacterium sp.]|nr:AbrB/MazE/SpoVT family DNA-binding domain-containing protein [Desulfobacterium sp.]
MACVKTIIFMSNRSQAVRPPKEVAFSESVKHVENTVIGNKQIITLEVQSWDEWFDGPEGFSDFMSERKQSKEQHRETF